MGVEPGNEHIPPEIDGSSGNPRQRIHVSMRNCKDSMFSDFVDKLLNDTVSHPVPGSYDNNCCISCDNLSVHLAPYVTNIIRNCASHNHLLSVNRQPYHPKNSPVE